MKAVIRSPSSLTKPQNGVLSLSDCEQEDGEKWNLLKRQSLRITQPPSMIEVYLHQREGLTIVDRLANELRHALRFGQNDNADRLRDQLDEVLWMGLHPSANDNHAVTLATGVSLRFLRLERRKRERMLVLELDLDERSDSLFYENLRRGEASHDPGQGGGWSLVPIMRQNRLVIHAPDHRAFDATSWEALSSRLIRHALPGLVYELRPLDGERVVIPLTPAALQLGLPRAEEEPHPIWDEVFSVGNDVRITLAETAWGPQLRAAQLSDSHP